MTRYLIATFFIAACALPASANAQKVYRCGNHYSQVPCPDAVEVQAQDARSAAEKNESDIRVRKAAATADAMERKRLLEEAQALAGGSTRPVKQTKKTNHAKNTADQTAGPAHASVTAPDHNKKKSGAKKKEPEFFTARVIPAEAKKTNPQSPTKP